MAKISDLPISSGTASGDLLHQPPSGPTARLSVSYLQRSFQVDVRDYGADPTGVADSKTAFRNAIAAAKASGANGVYAPPGVYTFTPTLNGIVLPLTTGVSLRGAGRAATVFKIKNADNPASPVNWKAFIGSNTFTTDDLTGMELADFTFDYNTANNPVVDVASLTSGNRAMFMAPKGDRIRIHSVDVINGDGKWVVQMGGTYAAAIQSGYRCDDAYVDIHVENFGLNSTYHDSSAVYIIGDRAKVRGTYNAATTAPGATAAMELHGNDYDVQVTVDGFVSAANLTGLDLSSNTGAVVHGCVARNVMAGFVIWSGNSIGATGYGIDGLSITGNVITLNPDLWSGAGKASPPGNFSHGGVVLNDMGATYNLPMRNLKIRGNTFRWEPATATAPKTVDSGIALIRSSSMSGTPLPDTNIDISNNTFDSPLAAGVVVDLSNNVNNFTCKGLNVHNPISNGIGTLTSKYASGMYLEGKFFGLSIANVVVTDDRDTPVTVSGVDMSGVSNINPPTGRQTVTDVTVVFTTTGGSVGPVVGPSGGTGGVYMRVANHGYYAPSGRFTYGSEYVDYGNGHTYKQVSSPAGTAWQVWQEIRPEGVLAGAANVTPAVPTGLPYLPMLNNAGGAPTAAPTTRTGMVPLVVDAAGKLWIYIGGAWQGVATA